MENNWAILQAGNLYTFGLNNPVMWADPSGLIIELAYGATYVQRYAYEQALQYLMQSPTFAQMYRTLMEAEEVFTIVFINFENQLPEYYHANREIRWDITGGLRVRDEVMSAAMVLAHEMAHAESILLGTFWFEDDLFVMNKREHVINRELGELTRNRRHTRGSMIRMNNPTDFGVMVSNPDRSWWQFNQPSRIFESRSTWTKPIGPVRDFKGVR